MLQLPPMLHILWKAQRGLLSLLVRDRDFFPYWRETGSSVLAGMQEDLLSLPLLHRVFIPCWWFTGSSFFAGASHISYFKIIPWQPNKTSGFRGEDRGHLGFPIGTVLSIFDLEVILLLQSVWTQIAQRFRKSQKLVFKMAAMAAILDFQSAWF